MAENMAKLVDLQAFSGEIALTHARLLSILGSRIERFDGAQA
jgi:hypothetical protein